jgi:hypothetical protein
MTNNKVVPFPRPAASPEPDLGQISLKVSEKDGLSVYGL